MHLSTPSTFGQSDESHGKSITAEASRFRRALVGESRSATLTQLFDFLLERSADLRAPKEIEIAMAVFGQSGSFDTSQDSKVRVHMHRLRQRLDNFNAGKSGPRLQIPKGEYRLVLSDRPEDSIEEAAPPPRPEGSLEQSRQWHAIALILVATALFWTALFIFGRDGSAPSSLGQTSFWRPIATHRRLPLIVAGDFYMVVESGPDGKVQRLSMHPMIRSGRDLDNYLSVHPDQYSKLHDRDIHRVPAKVATAAAAILPLVSAMRPDHGMADIIPASQVSQETIDSSNVIYIEHFSELGMLRSPLLHLSDFKPGAHFNELKDIPSGKLFTARTERSGDASNAGSTATAPYGYDYGYIASYRAPSGNQILIISAIEDAALSQLIRLVSDKRQLDLLARKTGGGEAFEALYQVRTVGGLIFDTSLLIARPLKADRIKPAPL